MRAIKFKAKDINGGWVYGSFLSSEMAIIDEFGAKYYIEPDTLCQFVGITDRNGVEVYEDDIIQSKRGDRGRVVFCELSWMVAWDCNPFYVPLSYSIDRFIVVGNEHDKTNEMD